MDIFLIAWELLLEKIKTKTSWGNVELQKLMLQCFMDAGKKVEENKRFIEAMLEKEKKE